MLKRIGVAGALAAIAVLAVSSAVPATGHGGGGGDRIRIFPCIYLNFEIFDKN